MVVVWRERRVEVRFGGREFVVGGQRVASWAWGQAPGVMSRRDTQMRRVEEREMVKTRV